MDEPETIDLESWARAEHFEHYRRRVPCTYSITVQLDVTEFAAALRGSHRKTYPAQIWALAAVVNRHSEFRLTLNDQGKPATWPVLDPSFTVFNPRLETFACVWTPFRTDFAQFHDEATELLAEQRNATSFFPQGEIPANTFDVSSLPWTEFTGFNLNIAHGWDHFLPIFTLGRYAERDGRTLLPLAVEVHHAAADGFHTARLIEELRELMAKPTWAV